MKARGSLGMKLVLLVEDEYGHAEILQLLLEAEGFRVCVASNGRAALDLLAGEKPAVILSDFMMPHLTGGELGLAVRANPLLEDIPFIILSGTQETVVQKVFSDYDAFVEKPFAADALLKLVTLLAVYGRRLQPPTGDKDDDPKFDATLQRLLRNLKIPPA